MDLPNPLPRPPRELETLRRIWQPPSGLRFLTVVNNNYVGTFYVAAALMFFLLAGLLALAMRAQLAVPGNTLLTPQQYNQVFTMHGSMMMFLFAVPMVEAIGILLLPNMLGARDLPFPRLSAYAFWAYFVGGSVFFLSIFFGAAPTGGWFMYPPLTSTRFSPGVNEDFWLLGIGFIEISAIAGAIEILVGILRTRSPGMTLERLPVFAWAMLIFAAMILIAFPALIVATILLELERAFDWPFFVADRGGDPLLWQHLFWFFGHPEVYIIFLPAAGMVSMILPTMVQAPLVGYRLVVLALIGTALLSFGLWVHHMFTTGIPELSVSFFSAASMAVAIPSGIQVFAWIATLAAGRVQPKTPLLFVLGFLFTFVLGGLTGVMVGLVPFDWQVHDTYFVVAHLHYVLFGGMVFPLLAAFYYWMPYASARPLSERLGRWVFGLVFAGFNVTFFPMHFAGLAGMPRRVYSYPAGLGWDTPNLISSAGALLLAAGLALFVFDLLRNFRLPSGDGNAGNLWNAGTLEWLPNANYSNRSIPIVRGRDPLWDQPGLADDVAQGRYYLPGSATGRRETILTSAVEAQPQALLLMPGPALSPVLSAVFTAAFFLLLTVKLVVPAVLCGLIALAALFVWLWDTDPGPAFAPVQIGGGIELPVYVTGRDSHSRWAMIILLIVAAAILGSLVFSYLYLWVGAPQMWPSVSQLPPLWLAALQAASLVASSAAIAHAQRALQRNRHLPMRVSLLAAAVLALTSAACETLAQLHTGISPSASAYGATVWLFAAVHGFYVAVAVLMAGYLIARSVAGLVDAQRRATAENVSLFWHYVVAQGLAIAALLHLFPRAVA
ncbi:MAG TPA: cytochrome c oxidase subunit I [Burkholderiaceae bacterium]|nr:cytochrome c oxidase subunit I [Burkholderiaceae bacterium]